MLPTKTCLFCSTPKTKNWIVEKHFLGDYGRILKEVNIGGAKSEEQRQPINLVYYCSLKCMEAQFEQEEVEDWKKGKCAKCGDYLVVLNDNCLDLEHLKEMKYLPIITPDCLK